MYYLINYDIFNENYKHLYKPKHPFPELKIGLNDPIKGGCVFILSNPFKNGKRKIYMSIIEKIRIGKDNQYEALFTGNYYILKQHLGDIIMPEKIGYISPKGKFQILNMTSDSLVLNDNKTPLWQISSKFTKLNLFTNYQSALKDLFEIENIEIPITEMTSTVNLYK
jgi:hypothetical protein